MIVITFWFQSSHLKKVNFGKLDEFLVLSIIETHISQIRNLE
jgi:hypothetical protein